MDDVLKTADSNYIVMTEYQKWNKNTSPFQLFKYSTELHQVIEKTSPAFIAAFTKYSELAKTDEQGLMDEQRSKLEESAQKDENATRETQKQRAIGLRIIGNVYAKVRLDTSSNDTPMNQLTTIHKFHSLSSSNPYFVL
ncbi:hypothetical protein BDC45DRAFT_574045 [Circinella umbellata]|nr:hypothetical protein BDC45DRAFT_574045 [Circinella umbellata]